MKTLKFTSINLLKEAIEINAFTYKGHYYLSRTICKQVADFCSRIPELYYSIDEGNQLLRNQVGLVKTFHLSKKITCSASIINKDDFYVLIVGTPETEEMIFFYLKNVDKERNYKLKVCVSNDLINRYKKKFNTDTKEARKQLTKYFSYIISFLISSQLFMQTVPIERKTVLKKTVNRSARVRNKSGQDVTIVSSSWYTNLIAIGESFVKGHWRNQPYGRQRRLRRLIFINPHKRGNYHRRAKKTIDSNYKQYESN